MNDNLPKVLVLSINAWQDDSPNHTFSDIFSCWEKEKLAHIYVRSGIPSTNVCDSFLKINENAVIKSVFNRKVKTAKRIQNGNIHTNPQEVEELRKEQKRYSKRGKHYNWFKAFAREAVWSLGKWKTEELRSFIDDFAPDVIFLQLHSVLYMSKIQRYVIDYANKPVVCYMTDDSYSYIDCGKNLLFRFHRFLLRKDIRAIMKKCNRMFVMTPKAKELCGEMFSVKSEVLTKAVDYSQLSFEEPGVKQPIDMIYTGRLVIGRDRALVRIARAIHSINRESEKIRLSIYSPDRPLDEMMKELNTGSVRFMGEVSREETERLQSEAQVVLFAESLDKDYINAARLSFSTKLTDYFASGRCIFALGSKDIAPIDYLKKEDAALVVTSYADIEDALRRLCDNPELIKEYGRKAFECGKRNHSEDVVYSRFKDTMTEVASGENK